MNVVRSEKDSSEHFEGVGFVPEGPPGVEPNVPPGYKESFGEGSKYDKNEKVRNYEISQQVSHIQSSPYKMKRTSVAVWVDGTWKKVYDPKGKPVLTEEGGIKRVYVQRLPEEIRSYEEIVKGAIGYNPLRRDTVVVKNIQFDRSRRVRGRGRLHQEAGADQEDPPLRPYRPLRDLHHNPGLQGDREGGLAPQADQGGGARAAAAAHARGRPEGGRDRGYRGGALARGAGAPRDAGKRHEHREGAPGGGREAHPDVARGGIVRCAGLGGRRMQRQPSREREGGTRHGESTCETGAGRAICGRRAPDRPCPERAAAHGAGSHITGKKTLTGRQKAAIFLVTLGSEVSAEIFKHLREDEIEQLTFEIARLETVDPGERDKVLMEFQELMMAQDFITSGGIDYARDLLERALGSQKAIDIINRLTSSLQVRPFDFITANRPEPPPELHPGRAPADDRPHPRLPRAEQGVGDTRRPARRHAGGRGAAHRDHGPHLSRRAQRSGARARKEALHAGERGLHRRGRHRNDRRHPEPRRPEHREDDHRVPRGGRPGARRGDQEA